MWQEDGMEREKCYLEIHFAIWNAYWIKARIVIQSYHIKIIPSYTKEKSIQLQQEEWNNLTKSHYNLR